LQEEVGELDHKVVSLAAVCMGHYWEQELIQEMEVVVRLREVVMLVTLVAFLIQHGLQHVVKCGKVVMVVNTVVEAAEDTMGEEVTTIIRIIFYFQ
jgi:hypothetical protein